MFDAAKKFCKIWNYLTFKETKLKESLSSIKIMIYKGI